MEDSIQYASLRGAATGLLGETMQIMATSGEVFAVVGGWSPLLLNGGPIPHPGTRDVDLLFDRGAEEQALREVIQAFLSAGYLPSAKHPFQVLRPLRVGSAILLFNVDLLHPSETLEPSINSDLFADHMQLEAPLSADTMERYAMKSIALPQAGFVFDDHRITTVPVPVILPSGEARTVDVPVIDELALLITKSNSAQRTKRERDSFDLFVAVTQARNREQLADLLSELQDLHAEVFDQARSLQCYLTDGGRETFNANVGRYLPEGHPRDLDFAQPVVELLEVSGAVCDHLNCGRRING